MHRDAEERSAEDQYGQYRHGTERANAATDAIWRNAPCPIATNTIAANRKVSHRRATSACRRFG
jgi:hypothetical protein